MKIKAHGLHISFTSHLLLADLAEILQLVFDFQVLQRSEQDYLGATSSDITRQFRNADPDLHPFERAREYQRALKATERCSNCVVGSK